MKWDKGTDKPVRPPRVTNPQTEPTPVDIRVGSFSEIDSARQCPHKHQLSYRERWVSPTESPALTRGTRWHWIMETWYLALREGGPKRTYKMEVIQQAMADINQFLKRIDDEQEQRLLTYMWGEYRRCYGLDMEWEILSVEGKIEIPLPNPRGGESKFGIKLKMDLVVRDFNGSIAVVDHKTCRVLPYDKEYAIDDQFALYTWGLRQTGLDCAYSLHSAARTFVPAEDDRPKNSDGLSLNKDGSVSKRQPAGGLLSERFKRTRMHRTDLELENIAREVYTTLEAMWDADTRYRVPDGERCRWRCDYLEACLAGRKGLDEKKMLRTLGFVQDFTRH